jgi:hypothetical protein
MERFLKYFFAQPVLYTATSWTKIEEYSTKKKNFIIERIDEMVLRIPNKELNNKYLMRAIRSSYCITNVVIIEKEFTMKEWTNISQAVVDSQSIKQLMIRSSMLHLDNLPFISKIFAQNPRIKRLILNGVIVSPTSFEALCSIVSSFVRKLRFSVMQISSDQIATLRSYLDKSSRSIAIEFDNKEVNAEICDIIKWKCFSSFKLVHNLVSDELIDKFTNALKTTTTLKSLAMINVDMNMKEFCSAVASNSSLTSLKLLNCLRSDDQTQYLCQAIEQNPNITKLSLREFLVSMESSDILDKLKSSRSLTSLKIALHMYEAYESLCTVLIDNKTLKSLLLWTMVDKDHVPLSNLIKSNSTLTRLTLSNLGLISAQAVRNICNALKSNRTIRSISLPMSIYDRYEELAEVFRTNDSLTHLDISRTNLKVPLSVQKHFCQALKNNRVLSQFDIYGEYEPDLKELLEKNRLSQLENVRKTTMLINMIVLRKEQFFAIFPLEIWLMILADITFPGVIINFAERLLHYVQG